MILGGLPGVKTARPRVAGVLQVDGLVLGKLDAEQAYVASSDGGFT
jgi:hypothetical protein